MKSMPLGSPAGGQFTSSDIKGKMYGFRGSGKQQPGQTAQEGTGGRRDQTANGGGTGIASSDYSNKKHGSNRYYAGTQQEGTTGPSMSGGDTKFAAGGKTKMFSNRGSRRAVGGNTAPD